MRQSCANWTKPKHNQGRREMKPRKGEEKKRKCIWLARFFESVLGSYQTRFSLDDRGGITER